MRHILLTLAVLLPAAELHAPPKISIVVGAKAPKLERFAADELAVQLKQLFEAEVMVVEKLPDGTDHLILVGSPATNPAIARAMGDKWPKLSEQGHMLRSTKLGERDALVVGGGSPAATLWAASELAHHFGIRSFLHGDLYPEKKPELKLTGLDLTLEPALKVRGWTLLDTGPTGFGAWGLDDYKKFLGQLAKLKFNRVVLAIDLKEPSLPFDGRRFLVAGDTPGRKAFKGAKEFDNPATLGKTTDADRKAAMGALAKQLSAAAADFGMEASYNAELHGITPPNLFPPLTSTVQEDAKVRGYGFGGIASNSERTAYHLSRRAFGPKLTAKDATVQLLTPVIGEASTERAMLGFRMIDEAAGALDKNDFQGIDVSPGSIAKQLKIADAPPAWWKEAGKHYTGAMNEMYRAIRATYNDAARPELLYHAKRCEFAMHYFAALESARLAGVAKAKGDKDATVSHLEKATESLYSALTALGDVARDPSDRGAIAVLAEDAYRPLKAALKEADKK